MKRLCLALALTLLLVSPAWAQRQLVDRVIAVVNDEAVTQSELDLYLRPLYEDLQKQYEGQELMRQLNEVRLKLLNQMIEDRLVYQEAEAQSVVADEAEIDERLKEIQSRFESAEAFEEELVKQGASLADLRENLSRQIAIRKLHDREIRAQVVVSPREIEEYYQNRLSEFAEEGKMKIRSLTIRKSAEAIEKGITDEEARAKLQSMERRVRQGEAFDELAREFSEDNHAAEGGMVGWIKKGEMLPQIEESLFELKEGTISPVLETTGAYHLFKIEEKKLSHVPTLEEVRSQIHGILFREKAEKRFKEWMDGLKSKAYISIR